MARGEDLESSPLLEKRDAGTRSPISQRLRWQRSSPEISHDRAEPSFQVSKCCIPRLEVLHQFVNKILIGCRMIILAILVVIEMLGKIAAVCILAAVFYSTVIISVSLTLRVILHFIGNRPSSIDLSDEILWIRVFISQAALATVTVPTSLCLYATRGRRDESFFEFAADYTESRENSLVSRIISLVLRIATWWALSCIFAFLAAVSIWLFLLSWAIFILLLYGLLFSLILAFKWIAEFVGHYIFHISSFGATWGAFSKWFRGPPVIM